MGLVAEKLSWGSLTNRDFLKRSAAIHPKKVAFVDAVRDKRVTYKEYNDGANRLAHGLMDLRLEKGEFCMLLLYNRMEHAETFWALSKIGVVIADLPYRTHPGGMKELTNLCEAKTFIFEDSFADIVSSIRPDMPSVQRYICVGEKVPDYAIPYESVMSSDISEPKVEVVEEDPHFLNFSSGTTGLPKGFVQNNFHNTYPIMSVVAPGFGIEHDTIFLNPFPLYGRIAWAGLIAAAYQGATHINIDFEPKRWLEVVEREKPNAAHLVTTMAEMILRQPDLTNYDLSSLKHIVFAGSVLPESTINEVRQKLCPDIWEYYGFQEGNATCAIRGQAKRKKPTSVGPPVLGAEVRIVNPETDEDVPQGEPGEVITRGHHLIKEYFKNPEANKVAFRGGWFHTGDLGRFDEDGYLYLMGRVKDMIISGGYNVFASEVEDVLATHPKVAECAVIGLPDKLWGELVTGVVVPKPGEKPEEGELIQFCKDRMDHYKAPKSIKFTDSTPKNPTGKVLKKDLVARFSPKE